MSKNKTKAEIQVELEQAHKRIAELESAANGRSNTSERKKTEQVVAESEARTKELLEVTPDAMVIVDVGGKILMANAQTEKMFGYPQSELVGAAVEILMPFALRGGYEENRAPGIEQDISAERKNGEKFPVEISLSHHKLTGGEMVVLCAIRDVTERWRARELITAQRDLARLISDGNTDERPCAFCLQVALRVSKMDSGGVYLFDEQSRAFKLIHHQGMSAEFTRVVEQFGEDTPSGHLLLNGRTVYFTESDLNEKDYHRAEGLRSLAVIPIQHHGQVLGCLNIASHALPSVPAWSRSALETLAVEIGNIIIHRRTEESLKLSRAQLSQALVAARMGTWRYHIPTARVVWSPEAAQIFGVDATSQSDFNTMLARFHPDDRERVLGSLQEVFAQKKVLDLEYRMFDADGNIHWITNYGHVECDADGNPSTVVGLVQDITERKQAEQALRLNEAKWRSLFETCPVGIALANDQGEFLDVNPAYLAQFGYTRDEIAKKHYEDFTPQKWHAREAQNVAQIKATGLPVYFEKEHIRKDGTVFPVALTGWAIRNVSGSPDTLGVFVQDITSLKQAELELRESEERHRLISERISDYVYSGMAFPDGSSQTVWISGAFERITGYSFDEIVQCPGGFSGLIFPEDLKKVMDQQPVLFESGTATAEYRIMRKDGEVRWLRDNMKLIEGDGYGKPARLLGAVNDITDQKQAEAQQKEAQEDLMRERALLQLLIDNLPDFIFMKDRQSRFLVANQATARFMGADSPDQLIGKTDFDFYPQEPAAQYFAAEQQIMQTGKNIFEWDRPQLDLAQNEQWLSGTKIALYDGQGQVSGLVGIERDVTERKHAEDALRESESRYRLLVETSIEGIWIMDREHRTSYVNQSMADMLGYEPAEMLGKKVEEFFFPEDMEFHQTRMEKRHGGHDEVYERRFRRRDGSQLWTLVSARAQKDFQGNFNGSFAMFTDITERKQAQEQLSKNERILRLFVEHTPAAIAMFDREMRYIVTSERYLIDFRLGNQDLAGRSHYDVFPEMDDERKEIHQRCLLGAVAKNEADMLPRVDGSTDWVRYELRPWHDTNGEIGGLIFFSEVITERKHAEEALNKTQSLLTEAQRIGHIGHIEWSVGNRALICSEEIYAILGLPRETVITQNTVAPMMTDGERDRIRQLDIQSLQQRKDMDYEYRIRLKDGCERWLHQMGKITYDENGAPIRMLATIQDITERKRAEQALHESEEKYRGLLESLDSVVTSVDINGVFLYMNDIAAKQLGGMPAQFIGKTMYELFPKYAASLQMRDIQTVVDADQGMVVESPSLVNGKSRWYRTSIQPLHEENGQVVSVLINSTDIHELKMAQQELQELNRTLEEKVAQRTAEVQDLYDNAPTGYHSLDANGNFVLVNQTELNWLGYAREEMIGHAAWEFMTEDSRGIFREKFPLFLQQGWLKDIELEFVRKDGSLLPVSLSATAICDEAGNLVMSRSTISDITERKEAENTLRESEETYRALFENSNDAIFLMSAVDGAFVKVNPRCSELLGYPAVKLIGKNSTEFVDPQEAEDSQHRLSRLFSGERMPAYERRLIRNGGEVVETDINLSLIRDASGNPTLVQSVVRDITARKKAERALRESEEQNRLLFEESPVPIALLDDAGHIIHANRAYEQLTGFLRSDLYGKTSVELGLVDAQVVNRLTEAMLQSMSSHENFAIVEYSLTSSDGTRRIVESRVYLLPIQSTNRILVTSNDISMHKQAEETLRRANVELERAMQMKDEFLATMSHELRTPLTGILGLSESLQMEVYGGLNDRQVKTVKNIENSGRHLLELINDVLDLSKVEAGKLELQVARCSLEEICQASLHLTKGMAHQKQQHVNYSAPIAPIILDVDSRRIKQAIVNLFSNAIKFTPQNGELGLTVEPDKENCQVRLIVWDKGIGIKTENLSRLFQPFTQIDGSLAREYTGTGLGLALVRRLVELHDGSVTVESVFGEGSRFIITLPWTPQTVQVGSSAAGDHEESHPETIDENSSLPMILVADDNQVLLDMLGDFLETQKYRTAKVQSGQELLEKIASIEPDIILMDIQMPGMDGLEAIRRVRNHKEAVIASTIIIAVTALAMPGDRERCLDAGANEYMSKPVNLKKLVAVIQDLTGVR